MNRIQKKCMIVSAGIHLLLAMMLIFGPGFFGGKPENSPPVLTFVALKTTDDGSSGGGDNTVKNPPALGTSTEPPLAPVVNPPTPVVPPPAEPPPQRIERATPPVPRDPPRVNNTPRIEPSPVRQPTHTREIIPDLTVKTSSSAEARAKREAQLRAEATARAEREKRIAGLLRSASTGVRTGVAGSTEIKLAGPGGGGVPYGNFLSAVEKIYYDAWTPAGASDSTVSATITIARDGTILSAHITDGSGNAALDDSVQNTLNRVKAVPPLPESETRDSRTVTIKFDPETKSAG